MAGGSPIKFNALQANSRVTRPPTQTLLTNFAKGLRKVQDGSLFTELIKSKLLYIKMARAFLRGSSDENREAETVSLTCP